jgi:hypothetical protein
MLSRRRAFLGIGVVLAAGLITAGAQARAASNGVSDEAAAQSTDAPAASDTITVATTIDFVPPIGPSSTTGTFAASPITCEFASDFGETDVQEVGPCGNFALSGTYTVVLFPLFSATGTTTITGPETTITAGFSAVLTIPLNLTISGTVTGDTPASDPDVGGAVAGSLACTVKSPGPTPGSIAQLACAGNISIGEGPYS